MRHEPKGLRTVASCLGIALAIPSQASADRPIRIELVPPPDVSGQFCEDFMVRVHVTRFNEVATVFSNGETLITGALSAEVTNLDTGTTIALNIPGQGRVSADGSNVTATGRGFSLARRATSEKDHRLR